MSSLASVLERQYVETVSKKEVRRGCKPVSTAPNKTNIIILLLNRPVLTNHGRAFRRVFVLAQEQLRAVWGMELRELPVREKMTLHEKRQGALSCVIMDIGIRHSANDFTLQQ